MSHYVRFNEERSPTSEAVIGFFKYTRECRIKPETTIAEALGRIDPLDLYATEIRGIIKEAVNEGKLLQMVDSDGRVFAPGE
jgi:hypothetical protein